MAADVDPPSEPKQKCHLVLHTTLAKPKDEADRRAVADRAAAFSHLASVAHARRVSRDAAYVHELAAARSFTFKGCAYS